jgi:hypothetical protein
MFICRQRVACRRHECNKRRRRGINKKLLNKARMCFDCYDGYRWGKRVGCVAFRKHSTADNVRSNMYVYYKKHLIGYFYALSFLFFKTPSLGTNSSIYVMYLVFGFQEIIRWKFSFNFLNHAIFLATNVTFVHILSCISKWRNRISIYIGNSS